MCCVEDLGIDIFIICCYLSTAFFKHRISLRENLKVSAWRDLTSERCSMPVRWNITLEMTEHLRNVCVSRVRWKLSIIEGERLIFKSCPRHTLGTLCPVLACEPFCVCPCTLQEATGITLRYYPKVYQGPPVSFCSAPKSSLPCRKH